MSPEQAAGPTTLTGAATSMPSAACCSRCWPASRPSPHRLRRRWRPSTSRRRLPVRLTRKTVPEWVDGVIERALAKVPADRYSTAYAFRQAIERFSAGATVERSAPGWSWRKPTLAAAGAVLAVGLASVLWTRVPHTPPALDDSRVVVFPLRVVGHVTSQSEGEAVATYVGYALDGSEPLRWLDGWDYLSQRERQALDTLSVQRAAEVSRKASARYFIDGSVVRGGDSVAVVLRLHDVRGDSVIKRAGASQAAGSADPPAAWTQGSVPAPAGVSGSRARGRSPLSR